MHLRSAVATDLAAIEALLKANELPTAGVAEHLSHFVVGVGPSGTIACGGVEYYADYGRLGNFDILHNQQQQIFAVSDLNVSQQWEINFGVGLGATSATDHLIIKGIIGRRFSWGKHSDIE